MTKRNGWTGESERHQLASRGVETSKKELISQVNRCAQMEQTIHELSSRTCNIEEKRKLSRQYLQDLLEPIKKKIEKMGCIIHDTNEQEFIIYNEDDYYDFSITDPTALNQRIIQISTLGYSYGLHLSNEMYKLDEKTKQKLHVVIAYYPPKEYEWSSRTKQAIKIYALDTANAEQIQKDLLNEVKKIKKVK